MRAAALAGAVALTLSVLGVLVACSGPAATSGRRTPVPHAPTARATPSLAVPGQAVSLVTADSAYGAIVERGDGYPVYAFSGDSGQASTCTGDCAAQWPPLLAATPVVPGAGVRANLIGHRARADGEDQVTYAGHPLYTDRADRSPGEINGQNTAAFGGQWTVLNADGAPATAPAPSPSRSGSGA